VRAYVVGFGVRQQGIIFGERADWLRGFLMRSLLAVAATALILGITVPAQAATPAALWHMDDPPGSQMRDSAGNNNGTPLGAVVQGVQPSVSGTAYSFGGARALVAVPDNSSLDPGSSPITITLHANFTVPPPTDYDLIRKGLSTTTGGDYKMEIVRGNGTPRVLCLFRGSSGKVSKRSNAKTPLLTDGRWHTLQCSKTDGAVEVLVDGSSYGRNTGSAGSIASSADLLIGAKTTSGGDQYQGLMDEVEIDIGA
jgi:Concanavalin A-like lectin/glucanases superfamily